MKDNFHTFRTDYIAEVAEEVSCIVAYQAQSQGYDNNVEEADEEIVGGNVGGVENGVWQDFASLFS